ncbi:MAG: hypothetical protein QMD06_01570 [Candidatus Altarchaeum sp.]|nr:hypothetical protein [Candidatus Altarchaeum sp.]
MYEPDVYNKIDSKSMGTTNYILVHFDNDKIIEGNFGSAKWVMIKFNI